MRRWTWLVVLAAVGAYASDHNNIDGGRPLQFEDASPIAFGERVVEFGLFGSGRRHDASRFGAVLEYKHGFALNREWGLAVSPEQTLGDKLRLNGFELSYMHGFLREIDDGAALAYRVSAGVDGQGRLEGRLRGVASKTVGRYDKVHLNVDVEFGEREPTAWSFIAGYSVPLGYPRRFDQTMVAELVFRHIGGEWVGAAGLGVRRQMSPRSIFDIGLEAEFKGGATLRAGYSYSF